MNVKKVIITLENEEGENSQVVMHIPTDIANAFNDAPMFRPMIDEIFQLAGQTVINIEMTEETRHEMKREVWTEEQRKAYRENLKR